MDRKLLGWIVAIIGGVALVAQRISIARDILSAPQDLRDIIQWITVMFTDTTPIGYAILVLMIAGLAVATSEWWFPALRYVLSARIPNIDNRKFKDHWIDNNFADAIAEVRKPGVVVPLLQAYVHFDPNGDYSEVESQNISGVIRTSPDSARYTINFIASFNTVRLTCQPVGITDRQFELSSLTANSATIQFQEIPRNVALLFREVSLEPS